MAHLQSPGKSMGAMREATCQQVAISAGPQSFGPIGQRRAPPKSGTGTVSVVSPKCRVERSNSGKGADLVDGLRAAQNITADLSLRAQRLIQSRRDFALIALFVGLVEAVPERSPLSVSMT